MTQKDNDFDFQSALKAIQEGKPFSEKKASSHP